MFENGMLREKQQEAEEICIMWGFMIFSRRQILLGCNEVFSGDRGELGRVVAVGRRKEKVEGEVVSRNIFQLLRFARRVRSAHISF
jgi:hypothetical protein